MHCCRGMHIHALRPPYNWHVRHTTGRCCQGKAAASRRMTHSASTHSWSWCNPRQHLWPGTAAWSGWAGTGPGLTVHCGSAPPGHAWGSRNKRQGGAACCPRWLGPCLRCACKACRSSACLACTAVCRAAHCPAAGQVLVHHGSCTEGVPLRLRVAMAAPLACAVPPITGMMSSSQVCGCALPGPGTMQPLFCTVYVYVYVWISVSSARRAALCEKRSAGRYL